MEEKRIRGRLSAVIFLASILGWILSVQAGPVQQRFLPGVQQKQQNEIIVTVGKSADVLVPGALPKTSARLVTTPRTKGERVRLVPNVTVIPGNEDPGKTGRYYRIRTTAKTPPGTYQLQYYDGRMRRWNSIPANVVMVKIIAPQSKVAEEMAETQVTAKTIPETTGDQRKPADKAPVARIEKPLPGPTRPGMMEKPATRTTPKGSVAIDTVPLPEKAPVFTRTGPSKAGTAPIATMTPRKNQATLQQQAERSSAMPALRDDSYGKTYPGTKDPNIRSKLGFCPEGKFRSGEWPDCKCPSGYTKSTDRNIAPYYECRPETLCPEGQFMTRGAVGEAFQNCVCPGGTKKTIVVKNGYYSECVAPSALYDVTVTLDRLTVHKDCDNLSPGDWKMLFRAETSDKSATISPRIAWWPSADDTKNVDTGKTYSNPKRSIKIRNIHANENIRLIMNGVDCDDDMILAVTSWQSLAYEVATKVVGDPFDNAPRFHCGGEEVYEVSGKHDRLGKASTTLPGDASVVEYAREFSMKGSKNNTCADKSVYTAYFKVSRTKAVQSSNTGSSGHRGSTEGSGSTGVGAGGNIRTQPK